MKDYEWRHVLQLIVQLARLKLSGAMMGDIFTEIMMINIRNRVSKCMKWFDFPCYYTNSNPHDVLRAIKVLKEDEKYIVVGFRHLQ